MAKKSVTIEFIENDPDDEENYDSRWGDYIYRMRNFPGKKNFEVKISQKGVELVSVAVPLPSLTIDGSIGFDNVTLFFGDFGHVHLNMEEAEKFYEGFGKVLNLLKNIKTP
jgi:hypothetical protein